MESQYRSPEAPSVAGIALSTRCIDFEVRNHPGGTMGDWDSVTRDALFDLVSEMCPQPEGQTDISYDLCGSCSSCSGCSCGGCSCSCYTGCSGCSGCSGCGGCGGCGSCGSCYC
jgi:hypothetical protein